MSLPGVFLRTGSETNNEAARISIPPFRHVCNARRTPFFWQLPRHPRPLFPDNRSDQLLPRFVCDVRLILTGLLVCSFRCCSLSWTVRTGTCSTSTFRRSIVYLVLCLSQSVRQRAVLVQWQWEIKSNWCMGSDFYWLDGSGGFRITILLDRY